MNPFEFMLVPQGGRVLGIRESINEIQNVYSYICSFSFFFFIYIYISIRKYKQQTSSMGRSNLARGHHRLVQGYHRLSPTFSLRYVSKCSFIGTISNIWRPSIVDYLSIMFIEQSHRPQRIFLIGMLSECLNSVARMWVLFTFLVRHSTKHTIIMEYVCVYMCLRSF